MTDELKQLSALTSLNHMMRGGHFSICTIDAVGELLGIEPRGSDAYRVLRPLHCIDWNSMPPQLRDAVPGLINECLGVAPAFQFANMERGQIVDLTPDGKPGRRSVMQLLGLKP
jgi:predicted ester cyclase